MNPRTLLLALTWLALLLAPVAMVVGHLGKHHFTWTANQISTFAARAPNDDWITAAMLVSALVLVLIGLLLSRYRMLGSHLLAHVATGVLGAAAAGLVLLARYEEVAMNASQLRRMDFVAIRQQSFHDAGLLLFFYATIAAMVLIGLLVLLMRSGIRAKAAGVFIGASGPLAFTAAGTAWPAWLGLTGPTHGLKQRVAFLILWLGALLILWMVSRPARGKIDISTVFSDEQTIDL